MTVFQKLNLNGMHRYKMNDIGLSYQTAQEGTDQFCMPKKNI